MASENSVHVSDEMVEEALRKGLEERAWQDLMEYGAKPEENQATRKRMCPKS